MLSLLVALWSSASPVLLQDLAPGAAVDSETYLEVDTGADPNVLVIQNNFWGAELFTILDGRRSLIVDLCPGPCSGSPVQLTRLGAQLFFVASDLGAAIPHQLWITDGTAAGTRKLSEDVAPARIALLGEQLIFQRGSDLWVSDGTPEGTAALSWGTNRALVSAQATADHRFISVNPTACELFVSGTDVRQASAAPMPAAGESCAEPLATLGERAFLELSSGLWRFDATAAPPVMIDSPGTLLTRVAAGLFFFRSASMSLSLFHTTGEPGGTVSLGSVASTGVQNVAASSARFLYSAADLAGASHLYSSDGTPSGTFTLPLTASTTHAILPVGPVAYVVAAAAANTQLIETDGTASGTVVLQGVRPAHAGMQAGHREAKGHAIALALIAQVVNEFGAFRIRPGEDPESLFLKPANPRDSTLSVPIAAGTSAFFNAANRAIQTNGTAEGTGAFSDGGFVAVAGSRVLVIEGSTLSAIPLDGGEAVALGAFTPPAAVGLGEIAVFAVGAAPRTLWRTDGTAAGTLQLADLGAGTSSPGIPLGNGSAVFTTANTIWFSDGTAEGTRSIAVPGSSGLPVASNGAVWLVTGSTGVSRVTPDAVVNVAIPPSAAGPQLLTAMGDDLYFITRTATAADLWRASGSTATKLATLKSARALAAWHGRLMLLGDRGDGQQLLEWVDDVLVTRAPAPGATFLQVAADTLFADRATLTEGLELHYFQEYDGSPVSLLVRVADLAAGPGSSNPSPPVAFGKRFLFSAWTPEAGRELWSWEPEPPPPLPKKGCGCSGEPGVLMLVALALGATRLGSRRSMCVSCS